MVSYHSMIFYLFSVSNKLQTQTSKHFYSFWHINAATKKPSDMDHKWQLGYKNKQKSQKYLNYLFT